jgi:hypothetical protein
LPSKNNKKNTAINIALDDDDTQQKKLDAGAAKALEFKRKMEERQKIAAEKKAQRL